MERRPIARPALPDRGRCRCLLLLLTDVLCVCVSVETFSGSLCGLKVERERFPGEEASEVDARLSGLPLSAEFGAAAQRS